MFTKGIAPIQLPQAPEESFLLLQAAGHPLVKLVQVKLKVQAGLNIHR